MAGRRLLSRSSRSGYANPAGLAATARCAMLRCAGVLREGQGRWERGHALRFASAVGGSKVADSRGREAAFLQGRSP